MRTRNRRNNLSELNTSGWGRHYFLVRFNFPDLNSPKQPNPYKNPVVITRYNSILLKVSSCQKHAIFCIFGGDFGGEKNRDCPYFLGGA